MRAPAAPAAADSPQGEYLPAFAASMGPFEGKLKFRAPTHDKTPLGPAAPHVERTTAADYDIAICVEFPNVDMATAWNSSEAYVAAAKIRRACLAGPFAIVAGLPGAPDACGAMQLLFVKVTDEAVMGEYLAGFGPSLNQDGKQLGWPVAIAPLKQAAFAEPDAVEAFDKAVIVGFPSLDEFHLWHDGPVYTALGPKRFASTVGPSVAGATLF